jgi:hypothetical protein
MARPGCVRSNDPAYYGAFMLDADGDRIELIEKTA